MNIPLLIEILEDFYEVWSDGASGSVIEVQKKLCDLEVISKQTAKKIIREPSKLRDEMSLEQAKEEVIYFENVGIKCKLIHVGPDLLKKYSNKEIEECLSRLCGCIERADIKEIREGVLGLFVGGEEVIVDYDDIDFFLYLSCLKYLAVRKLRNQ
ncbi:hypothetical protein [Pleionea sp. CnH1-48]|uniref:hypothetical protein n=1 Tax=Pleionea sp. CnH1-48 TaxID=2954494 RepID=UPI002097A82E|nr:hypothetical protein [Pleionea sp. CnH1-48]MCO7226183.1 hypothetical protein [Pleionea sp. CnH1-48]